MAAAIIENHHLALPQRRKNIRISFKTKSVRRYSHNRIIHSIQSHRFPERVSLPPKTVSPQSIADNHFRRPARNVFPCRKFAALRQASSQSREEPRGYLLALEMFRHSRIRQIKSLPGTERSHSLKRSSLALPIAEIQVGSPHVRKSRIALPHHHQTIGLREGQRREEHTFYHTENCGVCADAECEGENCDDGEAGRFAQLPQSEANVLR